MTVASLVNNTDSFFLVVSCFFLPVVILADDTILLKNWHVMCSGINKVELILSNHFMFFIAAL